MRLPSHMMRRLASIKDICRAETSAAQLWGRIHRLIVETVPCHVGAFAVSDPVTGLIIDAYCFCDPPLPDRYCSDLDLRHALYSYLDHRTHGAVSTLSPIDLTGPPKDPLRLDPFPNSHFTHAARVSFTAGRHCWGGLCLVRGHDAPAFTPEETAFLRALAMPVGHALRTHTAWRQVHDPAPTVGSLPHAGVMLLDRHYRILFQTTGVQRILEDISGTSMLDDEGHLHHISSTLPAPVYATCARLRRAMDAGIVAGSVDGVGLLPCTGMGAGTEAAAGVDIGAGQDLDAASDTGAGTLDRTGLEALAGFGTGAAVSGSNLTLRGTSQWWTILATVPDRHAPNEIATALVLSKAHPRDTASVVLAAYDLTPREEELVRWIRQGLSTSAIADKMCVSQYTVQDHLKSVFTKVGVRTRGELMAVIFREDSPAGISPA